MILSTTEREVVISRCDDESAWTILCSSPKYQRRFRKLAAKLNIPVLEPNAYTIRLLLPTKHLTLQLPKGEKPDVELIDSKRIVAERETTLVKTDADDFWTVDSSSPLYMRRLEQISRMLGNEPMEYTDSARFYLPTNLVGFYE